MGCSPKALLGLANMSKKEAKHLRHDPIIVASAFGFDASLDVEEHPGEHVFQGR
jgi:hypothetical protein